MCYMFTSSYHKDQPKREKDCHRVNSPIGPKRAIFVLETTDIWLQKKIIIFWCKFLEALHLNMRNGFLPRPYSISAVFLLAELGIASPSSSARLDQLNLPTRHVALKYFDKVCSRAGCWSTLFIFCPLSDYSVYCKTALSDYSVYCKTALSDCGQ